MTVPLAATLLLLQLLSQALLTVGCSCKLPCGYVAYPEYNTAYKIHNGSLTWKNAEKECIAEGGHLAIVDTREKMEHLVNPAAKFGEIFTGIYRSTNKSPWTRVDTGESIEYSLPWTELYPYDGYNCAVFWKLNYWWASSHFSNSHCGIQQAFVCEVPLNDVECNCKLPCNYVEYPEYNVAYKIHREKLSWKKAEEKCVSEGAHLAIVDTREKVKRISNGTDLTGYIYTGIYRSTERDPWSRIDTGLPLGYSVPWDHFFGGQDRYDCAVLWTDDGSLTNYYCHMPQPFVCEISLDEEAYTTEETRG